MVDHFDETNAKKTGLSEPEFLQIIDGSTTYYGANQNWFDRYTQRFGGCGPTAAANILAYIAVTDPSYVDLYKYNKKSITKEDFKMFMEEAPCDRIVVVS